MQTQINNQMPFDKFKIRSYPFTTEKILGEQMSFNYKEAKMTTVTVQC